jgi:hypothetical protein
MVLSGVAIVVTRFTFRAATLHLERVRCTRVALAGTGAVLKLPTGARGACPSAICGLVLPSGTVLARARMLAAASRMLHTHVTRVIAQVAGGCAARGLEPACFAIYARRLAHAVVVLALCAAIACLHPRSILVIARSAELTMTRITARATSVLLSCWARVIAGLATHLTRVILELVSFTFARRTARTTC